MILNKIKERKMWICCLLIFFVFFIRHFSMDFSRGDDSWFACQLSQGTIPYLIFRYNNWSSRLIIEAVLIHFVHFPKLCFYVIDSLMFVLIYYSILKITNLERNISAMIVLLIIVVEFPFDYFGSAGWYATILNYSWPLAFGLYCLYLISKSFSDKELNLFQKIVFFPCFIYAINQEQLCALMFGFVFVILCYSYYTKRKINTLIATSFVLTIIMLLFHGLCPGNELRKIQETNTFYPEFSDFSLIDKVVLGVLSTISIIITKHILVTYLFLLSLILCAYRKKKLEYEILSVSFLIIYFIVVLCLKYNTYIHFILVDKMCNIINLFCSNVPKIEVSKSLLIYLFSILVYFTCLIYCVFKIENNSKFCFVSIILLASLAARFILGLSASIFASLDRTFINTYFLQIICILTLAFNETPLLFTSNKINDYALD